MKALRNSVFLMVVVMALAGASFPADGSSLQPPPGARVAVVMFCDLQAPEGASDYPMIWEVATALKVPVVLHDAPAPSHPWAFAAAVFARFFDTKSQMLGDDFRGYIYKNQPSITAQNLRQYVQKFADDNKVPLPFQIDPDGRLAAKVNADYALAARLGVVHNPTVFVIGNGAPAIEVVELANAPGAVESKLKLKEDIEETQKKAALIPMPPPRKANVRKRF